MPILGPTLLQCRRFSVQEVSETDERGQLHTRQVVRHPGSVVLLPVLDDNHVCLIRNYRIAVDETLIELPAGTLEPDEEPTRTARRELLEETGYRAQRLELLCTFFAAPGILDEQMRLFLATGLTAGDPQREPGERIENLVVTRAEGLAMIADGRIHDAKTILGLLFLEQFVSDSGPRASS